MRQGVALFIAVELLIKWIKLREQIIDNSWGICYTECGVLVFAKNLHNCPERVAMKKKLVILLIVLMIISIAIGVSPIVDYFYANGAEAETSSVVLTSDTVPVTTEEVVREPNQTAVLSAVVLATGTILIALVLFFKHRDPEN